MQIPIVLLCFSDLDLPHSKTLLSLYDRHHLHALLQDMKVLLPSHAYFAVLIAFCFGGV